MASRPFIRLHRQAYGPDRTGLVALAEHYVDQLWTPTHLTPNQAREFVLDKFKRAVMGDWSC